MVLLPVLVDIKVKSEKTFEKNIRSLMLKMLKLMARHPTRPPDSSRMKRDAYPGTLPSSVVIL